MTTNHADRRWGMLLCGLCTVPLVACGAAQVPVELKHARAEYKRAEQGPAAKLAPADLHEAHVILNKAEQAFKDDDKSPDARDLAYIAWRRAQLAQAKAEMSRAEQVRAEAVQRAQMIQQQQAAATKNQLSQTQRDLAAQQQQSQSQMAEQQTRLQTEQLARAQAEEAARIAEQKLAKLVEIRHDDRGTVLSLSGSVLFGSGKSALLRTGLRRLDQVAQALKTTKGRMVVEGYTDSRGRDAKNLALSEARAKTVRAYLISRGVASDQVVAVGLGESNPIADNATAEGRANNRRVEIVIEPGSQPAGPATPGAPGMTEGDEDQGKVKAPDETGKDMKVKDKAKKAKVKDVKGTDKKAGDTKYDDSDDLKD